ncbi:MAG: hypothetical protein M1830_003082 [Pleopsidium flavum]|nr:MAG: hypothetical protein M1830_003082 [Pleopsidium flavum]
MQSKPIRRHASVQPGYYLPSYIEEGDPMEDEEKLKYSTTSAVGYKSYGRVPVALYEGTSNLAGDQITEPTTPLTASYDSQRQWWDDVPNEQISVPRRLRFTASDLKPSNSDYDTYIQNRDPQDQAVKCQSQMSTSLLCPERYSDLASGLSSLRSLENKDINTECSPSSAAPFRQVFGCLPVMMPSRNWNTYPSGHILATSSRSDLAKSTSQRSQLNSIPEVQHPADHGKAGSLHDSPLFKRRHAELPGVTAGEILSHHTLKRTASEVVQRPVVPHSPFLNRVVQPVFPLPGHQSQDNQAEDSSLQVDLEEPLPLTSHNLRLFLNHTAANSADNAAILTMPSGFPCAGLPVYFLSDAPALGTAPDGKPMAGASVTILDLYQSADDGWVISLQLAISSSPAFSQPKCSGLGQDMHAAIHYIPGSQYPNPTLEELVPASHNDIGNIEPFLPLKGSSERLRSMYSKDLRSMISRQIRSGSTGTSFDISSSYPGPPNKAHLHTQLSSDTEVARLSDKTTRSKSALKSTERSYAQVNQSRRPLNFDAEPYLEGSERRNRYFSAATEVIGQVRRDSSYDRQVDTQTLPLAVERKGLGDYRARARSIVNPDPSVYDPAEEDFVHVCPVVGANDTTLLQSHASAPLWLQDAHPFSWRYRVAMGENIPAITSDAFYLSAVLDPATYSLPYGSTVFGIKSTNEANVRASIRNGVWSSTGMGNNTLQRAWNLRKHNGQKIILIFSVNGSQKYCGMAEMSGPVNPDARPTIWVDGQFRGYEPVKVQRPMMWLIADRRAFQVRWIVCKDVSFALFQNMRNSQNNNLPVTTLRDATALPEAVGREVIRTYVEAPNYDNILLSSAQAVPHPVTGRHVLSSKSTDRPAMHSLTSQSQDMPLFASLGPSSRRWHDQNQPGLRRGYTPRIVGATNFLYPQTVPPNAAGFWRPSGRCHQDSPGRIPGATNYTFNSGRVVGATNYRDIPDVQLREGSSSNEYTSTWASRSNQDSRTEDTISRNVDVRPSQQRGRGFNGYDDSDFFYAPASNR